MHLPSFKFCRLDWMLLLILTIFSCIISFWGLGAREAPATEWKSTREHQSVVYQVDTDDSFYMMFYLGLISYESYDVSIYTSTDGEIWRTTQELSLDAYSFYWQYAMSPSQELISLRGPYIRIEIDKPGFSLWETAFITITGDTIPVSIIDNADDYVEAYPPALLIDEQSVVPVKPDYMNSMYFDEIHHATAGYEYQIGSMSNEYTHPPLGKLLIMLGIKLFGMTPFGWRFSGALAGALVVPLMYILGKLLFSRTWFALLSAVLMRLDLLLLVQSRMATVDSFLLLFILASYVCFIRFMQVSEHLKPAYLPLALSGIFFGLAAATKWSAGFAGVGLLVLFAWIMAKWIKQDKPSEPNEASRLSRHTQKIVLQTICFAFVFFVAIPCLVYSCCYLPDLIHSGNVSLSSLLEIQKQMWAHHTSPQPHPFESAWYEWPAMVKPLWLYGDKYALSGQVSTIMAMGNPVLWWMGILAMLYLMYAWLKPHLKRQQADDHRPAILLNCFLAQWLPWAFVGRSTFIYHFLPATPFLFLAVVYFLQQLFAKRPRLSIGISTCYLVAVIGAFVGFYPFATGISMSLAWAERMNWLNQRWFPYDNWLYFYIK